jgi:LmbE family N-acetylglucosaminyl deacetylase
MAQESQKSILAIGAHCGDVEVSCGAVLARHHRLGDRITILHLTLGEGGNPNMSSLAYGEQKRREALAAASHIGAQPIIAQYRDGELPNSEEARLYVADVIRQVKPTHVLTHWRNSIHKDHTATHAIVNDAVLLASLESVVTSHPRHRGVRAIYYTENWEDPEDFKPYLYVDVSDELEIWKKAVTQYEFIRGGISSFPYLEYYEALARVRGGEAGKRFAVAFDIGPFEKKRTVESLP